jgi:hypothetical protein
MLNHELKEELRKKKELKILTKEIVVKEEIKCLIK